MKPINNSATKLSDNKLLLSNPIQSNPPKRTKLKVNGFRRPLHLLECPWAQGSDYKLESSYKSEFKTFKKIQRSQMIRPTSHVMRDKESLKRSVFLRRQFDMKNKSPAAVEKAANLINKSSTKQMKNKPKNHHHFIIKP